MQRATIDIVLPVLNEDQSLEDNVCRLAGELGSRLPHAWTISIVDNGSTDLSWEVARRLAQNMPNVRALRLARRGRGGALKAAWTTSSADVLAYMDIDLSTDLSALRPLLDPVTDGSVDVCIGSRLDPGSQVNRSVRREVISHIYNWIARAALRYGVRDAQCGFKAVNRAVVQKVIPEIRDDSWFFDTELLVLAWRQGLRIREVPVTWVEDDDSRVKIVSTAVDDLRGIWRLARQRHSGGSHPAAVRSCRHADRRGRTCLLRPDRRHGSALDGQSTWPVRGADPEPPDRGAPIPGTPQAPFDRHARDYEQAVDRSIAFTGRGARFFAERKVALLRRLLNDRGQQLGASSVLDVGCGTGLTDRHLAPEVRELHGVDVSDEMLVEARRIVPSARFDRYDGKRLPFANECFDVVLAMCVLHHIPQGDQASFAGELLRVTRPGGLVAVFEHNPANPLTRRAVNGCELDAGVVLLRPRQVRDLLVGAGGTRARIDYLLFTPLGGTLGTMIDRVLRPIPLGGQHVVVAQAPSAPGGTPSAGGRAGR